ncbi:MAG: SPFH domain-containing protein [Cyclobacteriaceae bacterium]
MANPLQNVSIPPMNSRRVLMIGFGVLAIILILFSGKLVENVDNSEIVIIQSPFTGKVSIYTTPGPVMQSFGTATHYKKSNQFWFSSKKDEGKDGTNEDQSIKIRFNDGGHAQISGSVRWYMPSDDKATLKLHTDFGSQEAIERQLVRQVVTKAVFMTGPLMSSKESSAEKRNDLLSYIEDQSINGVYRTRQEDVKVHDDLMNTDKTVTVVKIVEDEKGLPMRQETSSIKIYGVNLQGLAINSIDYDSEVENQIKVQQQAYMQVQTAIANSKKAEQDAITTELQGKAAAAKAKWEQEVIKAQAITQAQQEKEVAALQAQTALLEAQKVKTDADAKSYANARLVSAGLTPQERAQFEKDTKIGVAEALSKIVLPVTYMNGGGGNKEASLLESILGVKLLNTEKK